MGESRVFLGVCISCCLPTKYIIWLEMSYIPHVRGHSPVIITFISDGTNIMWMWIRNWIYKQLTARDIARIAKKTVIILTCTIRRYCKYSHKFANYLTA